MDGPTFFQHLAAAMKDSSFNVTVRVYQPDQAMLDGHTENNLVVQAGTYQIPPIQKVSHLGHVSQISPAAGHGSARHALTPAGRSGDCRRRGEQQTSMR
jgi:hypothetical protein